MAQRVAIITGAGSGIGQAIAIELSLRGYDLSLVGRTEAKLLQTQRQVFSAMLIVADVSDPTSGDHIVAETMRRFGRIDALINNAGSAPVRTVEQTSVQIWREVIDINLSAAFYLSRAVWPTFKAQREGVIVNISSMAAKDPFPGFVAYGAAKAGLNNLGISLAREGEPIGIRVHTIAPGAVETAMLRAILTKDQLPTDQTLPPAAVARVVGQCVAGETSHRSGEVIWLSK